MKYLLVLCFVGFCLSEDVTIEKYEVSLKTKEENVIGKAKLELSNDNNKYALHIDTGEYNVSKCTYYVKKNTGGNTNTSSYGDVPGPIEDSEAKPQSCKLSKKEITFDYDRYNKHVELELEGDCNKGYGLAAYKTLNNEWLYVPNTTEKLSSIFPCQLGRRAELMVKAEGKEVISNIKSLAGEDHKVSLDKVIFILGDIVKMSGEYAENIRVYTMKSSNGEMSEKLKNIFEQVAETLKKYEVHTQVLLTPIHGRIQFIKSSEIMILSDGVLKPNASDPEYTNMVYAIMRNMFERKPESGKTFLDLVLPIFITQKIMNYSSSTEDFILKQLQAGAFERDGFNDSKSLNSEAKAFNCQTMPQDPILYSKGMSIVKTLLSLCGEVNFENGTADYIRNKSPGESFNKCFKDKSQAEQFFETWGNNAGYPVVHVVSNKDNTYHLIQEQFLWFGGRGKNKWDIPILYVPKEGSVIKAWLSANSPNITVKTNATYFILNKEYAGFYRVNYDPLLWKAIIQQMNSNHTTIDAVSRAQLIDDVFSFPRSISSFNRSIPNYVTALQLLEYLRKETDYVPLKAAFKALSFLDSALSSSAHGKFAGLLKTNLKELYKNQNSDEKKENEELKKEVTWWACKFGVEECIKYSNEKFNNMTFDKGMSEIESIYACSAVRHESKNWVKSFLQMPGKVKMEQFIKVLGCSRDKLTLTFLLSLGINSKDVEHFTMTVSAAIEGNPDNVNTTLDIVKSLKDSIKQSLGEEGIKKVVTLALPKLNTESANTLQDIVKDIKDNDLTEKVRMAHSNVKLWTDQKEKDFKEYFVQKTGGGSQTKPFALILLVTTLLPFANHIFNN